MTDSNTVSNFSNVKKLDVCQYCKAQFAHKSGGIWNHYKYVHFGWRWNCLLCAKEKKSSKKKTHFFKCRSLIVDHLKRWHADNIGVAGGNFQKYWCYNRYEKFADQNWFEYIRMKSRRKRKRSSVKKLVEKRRKRCKHSIEIIDQENSLFPDKIDLIIAEMLQRETPKIFCRCCKQPCDSEIQLAEHLLDSLKCADCLRVNLGIKLLAPFADDSDDNESSEKMCIKFEDLEAEILNKDDCKIPLSSSPVSAISADALPQASSPISVVSDEGNSHVFCKIYSLVFDSERQSNECETFAEERIFFDSNSPPSVVLNNVKNNNLIHESAKIFDSKKIATKPIKCMWCPMTAKNLDEFKTHVMSFHVVGQNVSTYKCKYCKFSATDEDTLSHHVKSHFDHRSTTLPINREVCRKVLCFCLFCARKFDNYDELVNHEALHITS